VVKSENIFAATQLLTPNWIVKYLVQNSVKNAAEVDAFIRAERDAWED
jgi:hypothetical protein